MQIADMQYLPTYDDMVVGGGAGDAPLTVQVTVVMGGGLPVSLRRDHAKDAQARTRAEYEAMDAEDIITQAEEAGAVDPVG